MSLYKNLTTPPDRYTLNVIISLLFFVALVLLVGWLVKTLATKIKADKAAEAAYANSQNIKLKLRNVEVFNLPDGTQCVQSTTSITCNWKEKPAP